MQLYTFLATYNHLVGRYGMKNHMHLHKAGYCAHFLVRYGNVYKYFHQGYENENEVMKRDVYINTQKGGGPG